MPAPGGHSKFRRPVPADFAMRAASMTQEAMRRHYRTSDRNIRRWAAETGIEMAGKSRPLPGNIADLAATRTLPELASAIGWGRETLRTRLVVERPDLHAITLRNGREKMITLARRQAALQREETEKRRAAKPAERAPAKRTPVAANGLAKQPVAQDRITCEADAARAFMQQFGPCFSRKVYGPQCEGYVFNNRTYTAEQLIDEAVKRGWDPDAWRYLTP